MKTTEQIIEYLGRCIMLLENNIMHYENLLGNVIMREELQELLKHELNMQWHAKTIYEDILREIKT